LADRHGNLETHCIATGGAEALAFRVTRPRTTSRVAQTLASQRVCGFPPSTTRGSGH
jgi:hypothetical protein